MPSCPHSSTRRANPKIQRDQPGYIDTSVYVTPLDVPTRIDRALGDQHPMGNPHINLDPVIAKDMVRAIADGLARLDPTHESTYQANAEGVSSTKLDAAIARWEKGAAPLQGRSSSATIRTCSTLPSASAWSRWARSRSAPESTRRRVTSRQLEEQMRREKVDVVVRELNYPAGLAETVAQATGAKLVELPVMAGGLPDTKDYISFVDYNVRTMLKAVQGG